MRLDRQAIRWTQLTVGLLSLNNAIRFSVRLSHMCSIMSHKRSHPAISRSEFVIRLVLFLSDITDNVMSGGHCRRNTVGRHSESSPMTMPPTPTSSDV